MKTEPYIGSAFFILTVFDSTGLYSKQNTTFSLVTSIKNQIMLAYNSSNPYLNEMTTYSLSLNLTTPNATILQIVFPTSYTYISQQCISNCVFSNFSQLTNLINFNISSTSIQLQITVINPLNFTESISITSSGTNGDKDFVSFIPNLPCSSNCRSCITLNSS